MEDIAEGAGFGVATLYNYFNTKEGIFATMAREDMSLLQAEGEEILSRLTDEDPTVAVYELLKVYDRVYEFISYGVMQEFITHAKSNGPLHEVSGWVLGWQQGQLARALKSCQARGAVSQDLDCELAAEILIDLLVRRSQRLTDSTDELRGITRLRQMVELILNGWVCPQG